MTPRKRLLTKLAEDRYWIRYRGIVSSCVTPEFDKYLEEVQAMHKSRPVRTIGLSSVPSGKKLVRAALVDQAYRSRCVELVINVIRNRNVLEQAISIIKKHVEGEYSDYLKQIGLRGITERKSLINSLVLNATRQLAEMDTIVQICDLVITDIDKSSYALKHAVDSLQIAMKRERGS